MLFLYIYWYNNVLVYIIWYGKYSGIHTNVSGIVLLEYLLYYVFALNL